MSERRVFGDAVAHSLGLHDAPMLAIRTLLRPMFEGDKASLKPYIAAGRYLPFEGEQEMVPGIRAIPLGHMSYAVESRDRSCWCGEMWFTSRPSSFRIPP